MRLLVYINISVFWTLFVAPELATAQTKGILAFGDIRGHLEPCGCDPRTDVGGLRRLSAAITRYRQHSAEVMVVHLGNSIKPGKVTNADDALIKTLEIIKPDASLINVYEWQRTDNKEPIADLTYVLSNAVDNKGQIWRPSLKVAGLEIFGFLGMRDKKLLEAGPLLFSSWKKLSKSKSNQERVLLFSGTDRDLRKIVATKFFGTVIRSSRVPLGVEPGDKEQNNERLLVQNFSTDIIWTVPFGGTGIIRLAGLEKTPVPKPLGAVLSDNSKTAAGKKDDVFKFQSPPELFATKFVHWLRLDEEAGIPTDVADVFEAFKKSSQDGFRLLVAEREKNLSNSDYVGAAACANCHASSYEVWRKSRHASAINTLLKKNRHEDSSCVECHVLGFTAKGGYVNEDITPHFSNVQCENCHGPRRQHVESPVGKSGPHLRFDAKKSCAECHTPPHSPGFDQKSYWKMIEHK